MSGIAYCREEFGYTQQELADLLGISRQTLSDYERGKSKCPKRIIIAIADIFMIEPEELYLVGSES